ncbi:MAG: extradiol dioxygenase [Comamonadaceae bacterium]|nr:MAG: extradiol dioxygenase [Comamonadaceae bacterium]
MQVHRLDHFTLRTEKLAATVAFFENVAGLVAGPRPPFGFPGAWLYGGGAAILHLAPFDPEDHELQRYLGARSAGSGSGCMDHIALRCTGLPAFEERLRRLGLPYSPRTVPQVLEHQVFVVDPNGIRVEFIFSSDEPASWTTDLAGVAEDRNRAAAD